EYYQTFVDEYGQGIAKGAYLLSVNAYEALDFVTVVVTGDEPLPVIKPRLMPSTRSVLVRAGNQLLLPNDKLVLLESPIDLLSQGQIPGNINSVLLDDLGKIHWQTEFSIGYKVGFYDGFEDDERMDPEDEVYSPVIGQSVRVIGGMFSYIKETDESGYFNVPYMGLHCPLMVLRINHSAYVSYKFQNFDPQGQPTVTLPAMYDFADICYGHNYLDNFDAIYRSSLFTMMGQIVAMQNPGPMVRALRAQTVMQAASFVSWLNAWTFQYYLNVNILGGRGYFTNLGHGTGDDAIPIGQTTYSYQAPDDTPITQTEYDFDGDDISEKTVLGIIDTTTDPEGKFTSCNVAEATHQAIYLSSGGKEPGDPCDPENTVEPDFIRLADKAQDFSHQGLLKSIQEEDFLDTDIYVFRESTGILITERTGLKTSEFSRFDVGGVNKGEMFYQMVIRGPDAPDVNSEDKLHLGFSGFQSAMKMNPALHQREADHLRLSEGLIIVAINRKTGYMGMVKGNFSTSNNNGVISIPIEDIKLGPPNIKIKAERQ
ncbi:MAG: hypothetical protein MJK04_22220, partial [Psychrosphaera sp.]|nr:hypothetical protein [Psychrosphaera sp.]